MKLRILFRVIQEVPVENRELQKNMNIKVICVH